MDTGQWHAACPVFPLIGEAEDTLPLAFTAVDGLPVVAKAVTGKWAYPSWG